MNNKNFSKLASKLATALQYWISCELISNLPKNNPLKHRFLFTIRQSLTQSFVIEVAKIFDSSKTQPNLTIYNLLGTNYPWKTKHNKTITSLKKFRNKYLMHNDLKTSQNFNNFLKNINLKPADVMNLLSEAFTQLEKISKTDKRLKLGVNSMNSVKNRVEKSFNDFLKILE